MQGQKTLSLSYNMHLFLPYLLMYSQTIHSKINFSKPLLCVMLICGDWSDWITPVMPDKAAFVSTVLLCVQRYRGNRYFNSKRAPTGKEWICIFIQTKAKRPMSGLQYANVSCWLRLVIRFKNDSFQWFRFDSFFWETITLYTLHFHI